MKKLLIIAMVCYGLSAAAQVRQSDTFLYLFSDSLIYADHIRLRLDAFNQLRLRVDSRSVRPEGVKFFSNRDGFFANTRKLGIVRRSEFAERVIEGKINLYQQMPYNFYDYEYRYRDGMTSSINGNMYYNKGFGDLKKVNYQNLSQDMADHMQSTDLLAGYRKNMNSAKIMYTAAGVSVVAAFVSFLTQAGKTKSSFDHSGFPGNFNSVSKTKDGNFTPAFVLLGAGAGFALGGFAFQVSAARHMENAIDTYNR